MGTLLGGTPNCPLTYGGKLLGKNISQTKNKKYPNHGIETMSCLKPLIYILYSSTIFHGVLPSEFVHHNFQSNRST